MSDGIKVGERIGGGDFMDIWSGVFQATNTNVNIQIVDKKKVGNALDNYRFNSLCDIALTLNHPNVLKYFKLVANDKNIAIVTEPIQGRSLRDYLVEKSNKRLPESEARTILRQIVEGVSYLHSNNIVHRNLTLHNIYISNQGEIKLGNFLICTKNADMYKPITNQKSDCHFLAPEVWDPSTEPDTSCDLWSMGVILYVLVCGCYPFDGKNEICVFLSARNARFMIPNFISPECNSLIRQLLQPHKDSRMKLYNVTNHVWYNNVTAPIVRNNSQPGFGYSLSSIPEDYNENEEGQIKQEENTGSLSDFAYFNIPLELANSSVPLIEVTDQVVDNNNENNSNNISPGQPRRRYSQSVPSSPQQSSHEEFQAEQTSSGPKMIKVPSRKRSADQEQMLAMLQRGGTNFSMEEAMMANMGNLGTTPPQPRKRTSSVGQESKEILNLLEMPQMIDNDLNNLSMGLEKLSADDTGSATNSPKPRRKKSDPNSPKSGNKKGTRRTYRRRSLDDFSHLVGTENNPDLPTFNQVFQEAPRESSFGYPQGVAPPTMPIPMSVSAPSPYSPSAMSPTMGRSPGYAPLGTRPISPATSMPMSPGGYHQPDFALALLEHQLSHMAATPDLPVQPPKIAPMVFYSPELGTQEPSFANMQFPFHQGVYPPPQNSQFDMSSQFLAIPDETLNLPIETIAPKHVSNFVGSVIPETEEEWANNVVNHDSTL
mmetsp:Transcript_16951/g.23587  ORF Transcript_16951/g.23587 Transcript_16951/m.23587 type:complete len:713 (+) Transcript_16951:158-2296(+)